MSANGTFDLSSFDAVVAAQEQGIDVEIKGPDGKKIPPDGFSIKVAGPDSERVRAAMLEIQQDRFDEEDLTPVTAQSAQEGGLRILAKATISWTPIRLDGAELVCNEENARKLYTRFPFMREQVERRTNRSAFMKGSAKSSAGQSKPGSQKSGTASQQ